jgi:hypothetical protein
MKSCMLISSEKSSSKLARHSKTAYHVMLCYVMLSRQQARCSVQEIQYARSKGDGCKGHRGEGQE